MSTPANSSLIQTPHPHPWHPNPTHSLLAPKLPNDQSCLRILPIMTKPQLRRALMDNDPNYAPASTGEEAVVSAAASNGAWGPIYSPTASNNNTGAIGTGYNILLAGAATPHCRIMPFRGWLDGVGWWRPAARGNC